MGRPARSRLFTRLPALALLCGVPASLLLGPVLLEIEVPINAAGTWSVAFWNGRVWVSNRPEVRESRERVEAYWSAYWPLWRRHQREPDSAPPPPAFAPPPRVRFRGWSVNLVIPIVAAGSVSLTLYLLHVRGRRARRKLRDAGLCTACGYDLRASPDRCPECGTPALSLREHGLAGAAAAGS